MFMNEHDVVTSKAMVVQYAALHNCDAEQNTENGYHGP